MLLEDLHYVWELEVIAGAKTTAARKLKTYPFTIHQGVPPVVAPVSASLDETLQVSPQACPSWLCK